MSELGYKVDPKTNICEQLANPTGESYKDWADCKAADQGKVMSKAKEPIKADDKSANAATAPEFDKGMSKGMKTTLIVGGSVLAIAAITTIVVIIRKASKKAKTA